MINFENCFYTVNQETLFIFFDTNNSYKNELQNKFDILTTGSFRAFCECLQIDFLQAQEYNFINNVNRMNAEVYRQFSNSQILIDQIGNIYFHN